MRRYRRERRAGSGHRRVRGRRRHRCCSAWPGPVGRWRPSTPVRSGIPTPTGSATSWARTGCTGPNRGSSPGPTRSRSGRTTRAAGVGGSMVHYAGYTPRFHPSDFRTAVHRRGRRGLADRLRRICGPTTRRWRRSSRSPGQPWPWGDPHTYPYHAQPVGGNGEIFLRGAHALGIETRVGPVAIANGRFGNRPHCIYRGFCLQGCKVNAKASPLITHVPDALAHGAEVRANCMVTRVVIGDDGLATGVTYVKGGVEHFQRARMVAVAGYSIETPRLLLLSAEPAVPRRSGQRPRPGRPLRDGAGRPQTAGRFDEEIRMYKAPPPEVLRANSSTRPTRPRTTGGATRSRTSRRCRSPTPSTSPPRATGVRCCASTCATTCTGRPWARCASSCPAVRQRSHPGRPPRTASGCPWPTSPTRSATTTEPSSAAARRTMEDHSPSRRRRRGDHHRPLRPPRRRVPHGRRRDRRGWSTPTCGASPCPTCTSPTAACCPPRARPTRR